MQWDDHIFTGTHQKWSWVVARETITELRELIAEYHPGQRLCITAIDSGAITPSAVETDLGWTSIADILVSPPITRELHIPSAGFDEWYIFESLPQSLQITERYVNYCGFHLAAPRGMAASHDRMSDRTHFDRLVSIQMRYWSDMARLDPSSYIAAGDFDIVVSRDAEFVRRVDEAARRIVE